MANYKRRKPRSKVRCGMCTNGRIVKAGRSSGQRGGQRHQPANWPKVNDPTRD